MVLAGGIVLLSIIQYCLRHALAESRAAEAQLRANAFKYQILFQSVNDSIFMYRISSTGIPGPFLEVSDLACEQLGYSRKELLSLRPMDITTDRRLATMPKFISDIVGKKRFIFDWEHVTREGRVIPVEISYSCFNMDGRCYVISSARDIRVRKENERELEQLRDHLEQEVEKRTDRLYELNQDLELFTATVSHDLRAPLRSIHGFSRLLLEEYSQLLDDRGSQYLERVKQAAWRMDQLIDQLLVYSRLSSSEIRLKPIRLQTGLENVLANLEQEIKACNAVIHYDKHLPMVRGCNIILGQVLENLLTNSLKFIHPGSIPEIQISYEWRGNLVRLWIKDNGIGIAPEEKKKIFYVFTRLHGIESYPGTGMGLAIVQRSMEKMGGRCGVDSTQGMGSCFWIELEGAAG